MINFLHPGFLYGFFVLAIPVILHLFSFKKYKKVYFSNFNFLLSLQQQKKNSSKLKNLLLLLLRLLVLSAIILAFASPYISPSKVKVNHTDKPRVVLYIDNSFSMSNTGSKGSLLEEAKKYLFDILNSYPAGTDFTLLTNLNTNNAILTREQAISQLSGLKTSPEAKTLSEVFREAGNLTDHKRTTLFILSDFQKNSCDFQSIVTDSLIEPVFLILKPENLNNLYIKEVSFRQVFHKKDQNDQIVIKVGNSSGKDFNNVPVNLTINGKKKSLNKVNIPAGGEESVEINYQNTEEGFYKGMVEIADFPVVFDNKFYFSYHIHEQTNILCMEQDKHCPYFQKLFSDTTAFHFTYTNVNQTANLNFNHYNLIILDRLSSTWTGLESSLETYLRDGGNLFVLPGERMSANVLNKILQKIHLPLFGASDTNSVIARIEDQSALFKDVFEKQEANTVLPRAKQFYRLDNLSDAEKLLTDKRGNTVLAAQSFGKGSAYISAFNYDTDNSDMVYHPLFVPVMVNMAYRVNSTLNTSWLLNSDKPVNINAKELSDNTRLIVRNEEHTLEFIPEIRKDFSGNLVMTNTDNIREAGIYEVVQEEKVVDVLAYNYDRSESQLQFCSEEELQKQFPQARVENIKTTLLNQNSDLVKEIVLQDNNRYLSGWFLLLGVIALLLEQVIWRKKLM